VHGVKSEISQVINFAWHRARIPKFWNRSGVGVWKSDPSHLWFNSCFRAYLACVFKQKGVKLTNLKMKGGRDEHGSGLKPILAGSGLDRTQKIFVLVW